MPVIKNLGLMNVAFEDSRLEELYLENGGLERKMGKRRGSCQFGSTLQVNIQIYTRGRYSYN